MSWRTVVINNSAKLELKLDNLVVRTVDKTTRIYLNEIAVLLIESTAVSITTSLLSELAKQKIKVIFCDEKHDPISELLPYYGSHDTSDKVRRQIAWSDYAKQNVWTEIIRQKITNQRNLLEECDCVESELLDSYLEELQFNDKTNREGHSAKVYFNALFGKKFSRSIDSPLNDALNYGYTIILSAVNREIVSCGYITQLGLFHDNMFNDFNFGSDLMEPFRIEIDRKVYQLMPSKLDKETKLTIVDLLNKNVCIDGQTQTLLNAIKIYCHSVFQAIEENNISKLKFHSDEL